MNDKTTQLFQNLSRRGRDPMLGNVTATIRFDIGKDRQTTTWWLAIENGNLAVSTEGAHADCVVTADKADFDRIAGDGRNAMAALLRGELSVTGDSETMVAFQHLLSAPERIADGRPKTPDPALSEEPPS